MEYNNHIKVSPAAVTDQELLQMFLERPGEQQELEKYISEIANKSFEPFIYTNYKGINLILERVTRLQS